MLYIHTHTNLMDLMSMMWHSFWRVYLLNLQIVFLFSSFTHFLYCSTLISITTLLFTHIGIFIIVIVVTFIILFYLLISFKISFFLLFLIYSFIYLFIYLFRREPIWEEGSPFGRIFNPGMLWVEGVSWHLSLHL